jgi:hypothetical protein
MVGFFLLNLRMQKTTAGIAKACACDAVQCTVAGWKHGGGSFFVYC